MIQIIFYILGFIDIVKFKYILQFIPIIITIKIYSLKFKFFFYNVIHI